MLHLGVPSYRLPRDLIRREIAVIESLGVEIRCGVKIGRDVGFDDLLREFAAVLIAVGAKRSRKLDDRRRGGGQGVIGGVDFLRGVALGEPAPWTPESRGGRRRDRSRSTSPGRRSGTKRSTSPGRPLRQEGVREVSLCCIESLEEMPADPVEVHEGEEEGIRRHNRVGPLEIALDREGRVREVVFQRVLSVFDESGAVRPPVRPGRTDDPSGGHGHPRDRADDGPLFPRSRTGRRGITERGLLQVDRETLPTTNPKVFVAGDAAHGTRLMIDAIASGKKAARSIYRAVTNRDLVPAQVEAHRVLDPYGREKGYEAVPRHPIPTAPVDDAAGADRPPRGNRVRGGGRRPRRRAAAWIAA